MKKSVICAGRLYCDLIFAGTPRMPTPGTEVFSDRLSIHAGGGAFITAATLSALGHRVDLFSVLPAPPFDRPVNLDLAEYNVSAGLCQPALANSDPQVTAAIVSHGDRAFLTRCDGPAIPKATKATLQGFSHLHIGELKTLEDNPDLLKWAEVAGLTVSMDCGWQDKFISTTAELIKQVDVFLPNERESDALATLGVPENCAKLTVIKRGVEGARAYQCASADPVNMPTKPAVVLDPTGAGDAFNAGFLSKWLQGDPLETCLVAGNQMGRLAVQSLGGAGGLDNRTVARSAMNRKWA